MTDDPDVLFVVLDSARLDRLPMYGHDRETTPALAQLADRATVYEDAHTPAPWTLPSHCSLFTGLFPSEHGVTNGFADANLRLPAEVPTLPALLSRRGYHTAGFSNNPWVGSLSGLDRGFDEFVEWDLEIGTRSDADIHTMADEWLSRGHKLLGQAARTPLYLLKRRFFTARLVERATRWLNAGDRPTFTFLNLMEAHSPYYPPGWAFDALDLDRPSPLEARRLNLLLTTYVLGKTDLGDRRERVMEYYDASLRYQDQQFSRLVQTMRSQGRFEDALVVVCADHGKTIGDYERDGTPSHYLRDVNTNVPLIVKWPGQQEGTRIEAPFELPRLFDVVSGSGRRPVPDDDSAALVEDHQPHTSSEAEAVTRWRALATGDRKYLHSEAGEEFLIGRDDDRVLDPDDITGFRDRLDRRVEELSEVQSVHESGPDGDLDRTVRSQLEDLGYLE
jgi:choline-sulfatase